ncbi:MAG TPA: tetratricopeptide repeat protein [Planctomycetaceae bacterium]|nr:tetratricopeptide repeat protein [Planctomycetaceae bacterium]
MRLPKTKHRLKRHVAALVGVAIVWLGACGCQGPQFDRLDGSPSLFASQEPVVDNGPPPSRPPARETSTAQTADAPSNLSAKATIDEKLSRGHRETAAKHYEQAEICYRGVLELEPDNPIANHRLAVLADRRGDFAISEKCYLIALKRQPNDPDLLSDLGYSYLLQGRPTESERCLFAALRANPLHQKARDNLGLLYAKQGDRERAFEMVKRSVGGAEARSQVAQFFPPAHPVVRAEDTFTASFSPAAPQADSSHDETPAPAQTSVVEGNRQSQIRSSAGAVPTQAAQPVPSQLGPSQPNTVDSTATAGQSPLEKQLAELMEKERQRATEERVQRESLGLPVASSAQAVAPIESPTTSIATEPTPRPAPRLQPEAAVAEDRSAGNPVNLPVVPPGRIPDDRINDAFAAIDREGSENSGTTAPATDNPAASQSTSLPPSGNSIGGARTYLPPQPQPNPLASMPIWPAQSSTRPAAAFQAATPRTPTFQTTTSPATTSPLGEEGTPGPAPPTASDLAQPRAPRVTNDLNDWESSRSSAQQGPSALPRNDFETATSGAASSDSIRIEPNHNAEDRTPNSAAPRVTRTANTDSKDGWEQDAESSTPQWPGANTGAGDQTPSSTGSRISNPFDSRPSSSPHIVPTGIVPASGDSAQPAGHRAPDELDEFEAQIKKTNSKSTSGRSSSNAGTASKPAAPGDPSTSGRDPWSPRIEPRRTPPPLFAPDDSVPTDKKPPIDKQNSFDSGSNWSEVPPWPSKPASGSSSADQNAGPAIRPGSF